MKLTTREPDFSQLLKVMRREQPDRPVVFELFLSDAMYQKLAGRAFPSDDPTERARVIVEGSAAGGYDYASVLASGFEFSTGNMQAKESISLNEAPVIFDRKSYDSYVWNEPEDYSTDMLRKIKDYLPDGMKLMVRGPCGVLENTMRLVGYDNLCALLYDAPRACGRNFQSSRQPPAQILSRGGAIRHCGNDCLKRRLGVQHPDVPAA